MTALRPPLRRHSLFVALLAVGATLRVLVLLAYRPVMIISDSDTYFQHAISPALSIYRPDGYSFFLYPIVHLTSHYWVIGLVQALLGLALATAVYRFLLRCGLVAWGAALAVAALLLDPLQLVLEHYLLADLLFEVVVTAAVLALAWPGRPTWWRVAVAGLLTGYAGTVRGSGLPLLVAILVGAVALHVGWRRLVALAAAGLAPLAAYAIAFHHSHGSYAVASTGPRFLYARLAPFVRCHRDGLPGEELVLCAPSGWDSDRLMWDFHRSPQWTLRPPAGRSADAVILDFDQRVVRAEPQVLVGRAALDFGKGFRPDRGASDPGFHAADWRFADHYWSLDHYVVKHRDPRLVRQIGVDRGIARFLAGYGTHVYLPGPALAALLAVALAAAAGVGRLRWSPVRPAVGLLAGVCVLALLTSATLSGPSWRYQLPQLALLPPAAALAVDGWRRTGARPPTRRALAPPHAVTLAAAVGAVVGLAAVASGWATPSTAVEAGAAAFALAALLCLRARRRLPEGG